MNKVNKKFLNYSHESMLAALEAVRNGMPCATAAKIFKVPRVTLLYKFRGKYPEGRKMGPESRLTPSEEETLVAWIFMMAKKGFPITKECFMASVARLVTELGKGEKFNNKPPGRKWYEGFLRRHPEVSVRMAQNLTKSRASVTKESIDGWFTEIQTYLVDQNQFNILQNGSRVFNADETAFFLNPKGSKVLARRGDNTIYQKGNNDEKQNLTVLITANANGQIAPPMIVYKYVRIPSYLAESVPPDWAIGKTDNGWMTCETFFEYITNIFHPWLIKNAIERPVIFFVDGHVSHMSIHLSNFCSSNGIILIALLPNATHLLQPMDVAVFRTLKQGWSAEVHDWRIRHQCEELKKVDFALLLDNVIKNRLTPDIIINGFRKCGLVPWDSNVIPSGKLISSNETEKTWAQKVEVKKFEEHLKFLEKYMKDEQLKTFKSNENKDFSGKIEDTALFNIWSKMRKDIHRLKAASNIVKEINGDDNVSQVNDLTNNQSEPPFATITSSEITDRIPRESTPLPLSTFSVNLESNTNAEIPLPPSTSSMNNLDSNTNAEIISEITGELFQTPDKINLQTSTCYATTSYTELTVLPSPFKRSLIWPEEKKCVAKMRKFKEKLPSVVSSKKYVQYLKKKQEEKDKQEKEKAMRKQQREEKKKEKDNLISLKKKTKGKNKKVIEESESESSDNYSLQESDISTEELEESTLLLPVSPNSLKKGDFIMVEFKGGRRGATLFHYACIIQDIENSEISVMALKCIDPKKKNFISKDDDISVVQLSQIVGVITPPKLQVVGERLRYVFDSSLSVKEM